MFLIQYLKIDIQPQKRFPASFFISLAESVALGRVEKARL